MNKNVIEFFEVHPEAQAIYQRGGFLFLHEKNAKSFLEGGNDPISKITREEAEASQKTEVPPTDDTIKGPVEADAPNPTKAKK